MEKRGIYWYIHNIVPPVCNGSLAVLKKSLNLARDDPKRTL